MKPPLVILGAVAMLVAALSASSQLMAAPAAPAKAKACSPLLRLPPATQAGQSTIYGHIKSLTRKGGRFEMRFDPALMLTGLPAERAALEDTGSSDVPNDSYVVEEGHRLLTFVVPATAHVTVITGLPGRGPCTTAVSVAKLARVVKSGSGFGFWIRIGEKYPSPVLSLDQQYHP
jgi:hypothetical protein